MISNYVIMKVYIKTYGCCANQNDSEIMEGILEKNSFKLVNDLKNSNVIIVNTCIVKDRTFNKIAYKIKDIVNKFPDKKLIIAGCMAESEIEYCKKIAPNSLLLGPMHIRDITKVIKNNKSYVGKTKKEKLNLPIKRKDKNVANVQIASGCVNYCSFCESKLAKGRLVSFPENKIVKEVKKAVKEGCKRINLTSTDNGCYGFDIKTNLPSLIKEILDNVKGDYKIRIGMMNPEHVLKYLDKLIEIYKNERIIKFLHIPVQSGSNRILKEMNRNYKTEDFKLIVKRFRKEIKDIKISTDIIVGYPTESNLDFEKSVKLIKEIKPEVLNISKFSSRPGTKASKLKQLKSQEIKRRSVMMNNIFKK